VKNDRLVENFPEFSSKRREERGGISSLLASDHRSKPLREHLLHLGGRRPRGQGRRRRRRRRRREEKRFRGRARASSCPHSRGQLSRLPVVSQLQLIKLRVWPAAAAATAGPPPRPRRWPAAATGSACSRAARQGR